MAGRNMTVMSFADMVGYFNRSPCRTRKLGGAGSAM